MEKGENPAAGDRANLRDLVTRSPSPAALLEGPDHVCTAASGPYCRMMGRSPVGSAFDDVLPELVEQGFGRLLDRVYETGEPAARNDFRIAVDPKGDGRLEDHVVDVTYEAVRDAAGHILGVLARINDQAEAGRRELEAFTERLESTNRDLALSRARLQATIDSSLDAIIVVDASSVIRAWNRHAEVLFGWSEAEAIGRSLQETIIPARYREAHASGVRRFLETGQGPILNRRIEIEALRRDGSEVPVELTVTPVVSGERPLFTAFVRDLSERRRQEAERAVREALTRVLSESRTLREAAPRALETIGSTLGWPVGAFWVWDARADVLRSEAVWSATSLTPELVAMTRERTFEKGVGLPGRVWERGAPAWIQDVERDDNFPRAAIAARAGLHGAFGFPVLSGTEFLGVIEFFHQEVREPDDALLRTFQVLGSDVAQAMKRLRAEEERDRALENLEQVNAALEERTEEAEAANRAKSLFLTNMSHELRTPINAIVGYADLLDMEISGPVTDAQGVQIDRIRFSSRHLIQLIEEILDFSKIEAGMMRVERGPARLGVPVATACGLIDVQAAEKGVRLEKGCASDEDLDFIGDEDRVRQIVVNLLSNAVKFTEPGGSIQVRCEAGSTATSSEGWVFVHVQDSGVGVPADQLEAIFAPFVQVETEGVPSKGGTGLGLSISRQLARLMGGDLKAVSEPGRGSVFSLALPKSATRKPP